jgi:hypothetical protein
MPRTRELFSNRLLKALYASQAQKLETRGLESAACECYGVIAREYERLVGSPA